MGRPETSVKNYHYSLRNSPEERSFQDERDSYIPQQLTNSTRIRKTVDPSDRAV